MKNHPTHAVRMYNNWDGEKDIITVFAYKDGGHFYDYDIGKPLLVYEGDEILRVWELSSKFVDKEAE